MERNESNGDNRNDIPHYHHYESMFFKIKIFKGYSTVFKNNVKF